MTAPRLGDRSVFRGLGAEVYLAHAAVCPPTSYVQDAVTGRLSDYAASGLSAAIEGRAGLSRLRGRAAAVFGGRPSAWGVVTCTTDGLTTIARSLRLEPGDAVVVFDREFPADVVPFARLADDAGVELRTVDPGAFARGLDEGLAALDEALVGRPKLVALSAVQFQSGQRMPLGPIVERAHARGALVSVDAIQALGVLSIDVDATPVDFLVAGGHKFLMGLEGAGLGYIRPGVEASLRPSMAGWSSAEGALDFLMKGPGHLRYDGVPALDGRLFEKGTLPMLPVAALDAALDVLHTLGVPSIEAHVHAYLDALDEGLASLGVHSLRRRGDAYRSALLCLPFDDAGALLATHRHLAARGIVASTPDGHLRFAPHFANPLDEVPRVLDALRGLEALRHVSA